ncbi:MAG: MFS transporter [Bacillota bacterium]|nr:MFS transporter [Bacillota bacterium]
MIMQTALSGGPSTVAETAPYARSERLRILFFALLGTVFDGADFTIFIYEMAPLARYFGTSLARLSWVQAASYVAGVAGGLLFGALADRRGRRLGLTLTVATYSLFSLASAFAPDLGSLLLLRVLAGIGIGGESGIAFAYISEAYPASRNRRGVLGGLLQSMFLAGGFVAAWLYAFTSERYGVEGWRWAMGYLGLVAVLAVAIRLGMPESRLWLASRAAAGSDPAAGREGLPSGGRRAVAMIAEILRGRTGRRTALATTMMVAAFFGGYAVATFAPAMWTAVFGLQASQVALLGYVGWLAAIAAYLVGGALADALGRRRSFVAMGLFGLLGYVLFLFVGPLLRLPAAAASLWTSWPFLAFVWLQAGYGYFGVQGVWLSELYPTHGRATAQNFVYYVARALGAGVAPAAALALAQALGQDVRAAIALGGVGTLVALLLARALPETYQAALRGD